MSTATTRTRTRKPKPVPPTVTHHILNLGAGVQSTALFVLSITGDEPEVVPKGLLDAAVFSDTQDEPHEVYTHLEWLKALGGPTIHEVTAGRIGDDLIGGRNSTGGRFAAIPAFIKGADGKVGLGRRQCTSEYKIKPIEKAIRRRILGLQPKCRVPKHVQVVQYMGLSVEEGRRIDKVRNRFFGSKNFSVKFPLQELEWSRADCLSYLESVFPDRHIPRSACVFCPYRSDAEWLQIKSRPQEWARAVEVDEAMRNGARAAQGMRGEIYLHRSCIPLSEVVFVPKEKGPVGVAARECEGVCGT